MEVRSFDEVMALLDKQYMPLPRVLRAPKTLEGMYRLLDALDNPQEKFKAVHVAGTSGKTSTAYYIAAMLTATGKQVGLTISPHMTAVNERVQIGLVPVPEQEFCHLFSEFITKVQQLDFKPVYFELLTAFAFWVFAKKGVEYAVVEVGVGGLLDATNVIRRADKVCVITDIGLDHTKSLGQTVAEIAAHKAGIIRANNAVIMYEQEEAVMDVVREVAEQQHAELHELWPIARKELPANLPLFQQRNWYLAWSASKYVIERDGLKMLTTAQLAGTTETYIPARMEVLVRSGRTVVLDGAHNPQKLETLAKSLKAQYPGKSFVVLLGLVKSKNLRMQPSVQSATGLADHLIITSYDVGITSRRTSTDPARVAEYSHLLGFNDWEIIADPYEAYRAALKRPEDIVVITGSFYMIDQLRTLLYRRRKNSAAD
jgi:dihydrofolate synthase/folylpolyglutamate synthase